MLALCLQLYRVLQKCPLIELKRIFLHINIYHQHTFKQVETKAELFFIVRFEIKYEILSYLLLICLKSFFRKSSTNYAVTVLDHNV